MSSVLEYLYQKKNKMLADVEGRREGKKRSDRGSERSGVGAYVQNIPDSFLLSHTLRTLPHDVLAQQDLHLLRGIRFEVRDVLHLDLLVEQRVDDEVRHDLCHQHYKHDRKEYREVVRDLYYDNRERNGETRDASHEGCGAHDGVDSRIDAVSINVVKHESNNTSIRRAYHHLQKRNEEE